MAENKKNIAAQETVIEDGFVQRNLMKIGMCVLGLLVCVLVAVGCFYFFDSKNDKALEALYPCEQLFQKGDYEKALNGDGQQVLGLVEIAKKYGYTKAGNVAKLYAGLAYAQTGKYEDAENFLKDFDTKSDEMISPAAIGALGNVYAELGHNDKAVETLRKAAKKADNNVLSPLYLVQAAEILEAEGKTAEALNLYEQVRDNYRGSMQGQEIEKYIQRVK